ncbi:EsaB/YukD family protein [Streptomyces sp. SP17BM10]|uniref:EsaB/YukD family protein n=1 Tax=Streptomyces sp. SP17BM10 TaxID=3002530 RepID=UPI002E78A52C|nr:EsaB/YukD family protein [Streptomyces sp. SP17BM10]MEE1788689.1 EsaB/YukD family protein [Streptomyces sp. SP17BM10]
MTGTLTAISPQHAVRRLTVVGPEGLLEVALPVTVPVVGLVPVLVRCLGGASASASAGDGDGASAGDGDEGWALRRIGGAVLRPGDTALSLGLRDGEVLHLASWCSSAVS